MIEDWEEKDFAARLAERERMLVLFYADWCPHSRVFLPIFEAAEPEASVPFARANIRASQDGRWETFDIKRVPTLVYFEHGEELERMDGLPLRGLSRRDLDDVLETIDELQEEPVLPKRMHGPRRR